MFWEPFRLRCAFSEATLVLTLSDIISSPLTRDLPIPYMFIRGELSAGDGVALGGVVTMRRRSQRIPQSPGGSERSGAAARRALSPGLRRARRPYQPPG